jgi:hypothetical protein
MSDVSPSESARQQACCVPIASRKVWGVKQIPNFGIACLESFQEIADMGLGESTRSWSADRVELGSAKPQLSKSTDS